ncbi:hypothetical protein M9Y10_039070 [Tritrichomonas musculus]|uniref:Uncharacterized protein n=1 Tax=Tritrichomonas musculus TaxID=1915356 RepID=A0ABR2KA61_9EUKA
MIAPPLSQRTERPTGTFITEMKNAQRYSTSQKSTYQASPSKSGSMLPSLVTKKPAIQLEEVDQCKLDHLYELLAADIHALKTEVMPMRNQYLRLKDRLLFQNRCAVNTRYVFSEQVPSLNAAIGEGTFSAAIGQFQEQSDLNTEEITKLRQELSSFSVIKLSCEVDSSRDELEMMKDRLKLTKGQQSNLKEQISEIKKSTILVEIEEQKDHIRKLLANCAKAENKNSKLTQLAKELEQIVPDLSPENQEAFDEIQNLNQTLTEKRHMYFQKCNKLIELRNKQMKEIQDFEKSGV